MDNFTRAYLECALWADADDAGISEVPAYLLESSIADCACFQQENADLLAEYYARRSDCPAHEGGPKAYAGHDFYLTRQGHGAGFWDRGLGELGDKLTQAAKLYGSVDDFSLLRESEEDA